MRINSYIHSNELKHRPNRLECVSLLVSSDEHLSGLLDHFINQLRISIEDSDISVAKNIDLKVITTKDYEYNEIHEFKNIFKSIDIIKVYIPPEIDVYYSQESECRNIPPLGLKSGPNYIFFETVKWLSNYNTTLLLECDIFLSKGWISKIHNYVENSNGFWVAGSMYDGQNTCSIHHVLNTHVNGGVGLYATGNPLFKKFIDFCYYIAPQIVKSDGPNLPYDYLIRLIIEKNYDTDIANKPIWQFIKRQYTHTNHIINYSPNHHKSLEISFIEKLYNYTILHKKP